MQLGAYWPNSEKKIREPEDRAIEIEHGLKRKIKTRERDRNLWEKEQTAKHTSNWSFRRENNAGNHFRNTGRKLCKFDHKQQPHMSGKFTALSRINFKNLPRNPRLS